MKIIKIEGKQGKELSVEELIAGIGDSIERTNGIISQDRLHSIDSHLRICMRTLGFKPRETTDAAGKIITTVPELFKQLQTCIASTDEITEAQHDHMRLHLKATNSNCAAEVGMKSAPELKETPPEPRDKKPPEPTGKAAQFKQYAKATKEDLLGIKKSAEEVLVKEPGRPDATSIIEVVTELLKKFN